MRRLPLLVSAAILLTAPARADTVTINPSADTCLFEFLPEFNWGAEPELVAGVLGTNGDGARCRILMKFDIASSVPAGSTITAAQLTMEVTNQPGKAPSTNFQLLRVLVPWEEGDKDGINPGGAAAENGETTWALRFHHDTESEGTPWTSPGGKLDFDFVEDPSASQIVANNPTNIFVLNTDGVNDLNSMLAAPAANFGWVLLAQNDQNEPQLFSARRWTSREHPSDPPELEITFTPPPSPEVPIILDSEFDPMTDTLSVDVDGKAATTYTLETSTVLDPVNWTVVDTEIAASDGVFTLSATSPLGAKRLFFRVTAMLTP